MAKKKQEKVQVNKLQVLVFRAEKPLMQAEWKLFKDMIDKQMEGQTIPYVIVPYSADVTVAESNIDCTELIDQEAEKSKSNDKTNEKAKEKAKEKTVEGGEGDGGSTDDDEGKTKTDQF